MDGMNFKSFIVVQGKINDCAYKNSITKVWKSKSSVNRCADSIVKNNTEKTENVEIEER